MKSQISYQFPFAKYPAIRIALLFIAGIVLGYCTSIGITGWISLLALALCILWAAEWAYRRSYKHLFYCFSVSGYIFGVMLAGSLWYSVFDRQQPRGSAQVLSAYTWEQVEFKGTLYNIKQSASGKYQLDVEIDTTRFSNALLWLETYNLRAIFDPAEHPLPDPVQLGNQIHFSATVYPLETKTNPHEFDYKRYLTSQNIYTQAGIDSLIQITPINKWMSWNWWRRHALAQINKIFSGPTIPLAKALLLGYKNELGRDQKLSFSRAGLSHIMAVSGLHVGFILAPFWFLIPFLWTTQWGKRFGLVCLILLLFIYAGLTGFSASVTRASITGGLITYGRLFHKARDSKNLTAVAAIIILLINPNELFEIGFQLSFAAVYIILLAVPVAQSIIPARIRHRWYGVPVMVALISVVVQIGLYPLLSYYFGEFSLAGPLANAVVVPALMVLVPYALFLMPLSALFPNTSFLLNAPCRWLLDYLQQFVSWLSALHWSWIQTPDTGFALFFIWITALLLIASLSIPKLRWKMLALFLTMLCMHHGTQLYQNLQPAKLEVTMLDVGQGDAALIQTPSGKHILVDAGRWTPDYNSARYIILPHLKALGVKKLDAVFLSHPHADHIGGILELINKIPIETIYNSGTAYESELYTSYLERAAEKQIPVQSLQAGTTVEIDPALRLFVYGPGKGNHHTDPNERSLVLELIYGNTEFLFMGDGGTVQEQLLMANYGPMLNTDFLKVGHHGSRTASSPSFLKVATPSIAAVSLARRNQFGHPHTKAINNLRRTNANLVYTSLNGALIFNSDGKTITQVRWK